jgi:NADH-quinone oxidoreductase subunit J
LVINPIILYLLLALGGVGIALSLPRRDRPVNLQLVGGVIAAAAAGLVVLVLSLAAAREGIAELPNVYFYIFAVLALGAAVRVISHPRPVYAALYFIMTVLASAGLFVLLSAEFLAFALVIVYAGAILITYLFVIMLATQAPRGGGDEDEELAEYDVNAREPIAATAVGFILLAVLTTLMFRGVPQLGPPPPVPAFGDAQLAMLPGRVEERLLRAGVMERGERILYEGGSPRLVMGPRVPGEQEGVWVGGGVGGDRFIPRAVWPEDLVPTNIEGVGFELLAGHPGSIEIAGVILLMAMLGAVVLARKQVELDEEAKARHAEFLAQRRRGGGAA